MSREIGLFNSYMHVFSTQINIVINTDKNNIEDKHIEEWVHVEKLKARYEISSVLPSRLEVVFRIFYT